MPILVKKIHLTHKILFYEGIENLLPIRVGQEYLILTHDLLNVTWSSSLFFASLLLKLSVSTPFSILQIKNAKKLTVINKEVEEIIPYLKNETRIEVKDKNLEYKQAKIFFYNKLREALNQIYIRDNCHPAKNYLYPLVQFPFWVSMSFALRCLTINGPNTYVQEQLQNEGLMTFTNLCVPDPYYVLPFVLFITNLLAIELMYRRQQSFTTPLDKVAGINDISSEHKSAHIGKRGIFSDVNNRLILLKWISRCSAGVLFYISSIAPSGLTLYWLYSCLLGISQNQLLRWIYTPQRPKKLASKFYHT